MATPKHTVARLLAALLACTSTPVIAAETDQYIARDVVLEDSADALNAYFNDRIEGVLDDINSGDRATPTSCASLTSAVMWQYRLLFKHQVEFWALNGNLDYFPPDSMSNSEYRAQSIYDKGQVIDLQKLIPLSRTIRIGDVHLGVDKLGHFVSLGHKYLKRFDDLLAEGYSPEEAETLVIESGFDQEVGMIGEQVSGVVSFADLEANYQGFRFTRSLCADDEARIVATPGGWELARPLDIRDYVNPYWDESFNNNVYSDSKWELVRENLQSYCEEAVKSPVSEIDSVQASANMRRVLKAERDGEIRPREDYSLASACTQSIVATDLSERSP